MKVLPHATSALMAGLLVGCATYAAAQAKVIGYAPSYETPVTSAQLSRVTHVNYAFLDPNSGVAVANVPNGAQLSSLVTSAHGVGVKVMLSVGGWTNQVNTAFIAAGADTTSANNFANSMMTLVTNFGLDGIDIDWEWPQTTDGTDVRYANVINAVCAKMHANGKLCSSALVGNYEPGVPSSVFSVLDFANIMAYDNGSETNHSTYAYAVSSLDYWSGRGLPGFKTVLGVPFYGYDAGRTVAKKYSEIVAADGNAPNVDSSGGIYYNGQATIRSKTTLGLQRGTGVMIWELGQDIAATDSRSLLYAIDGIVKGAATPTPTATTSGCSYPAWTQNASYAVGAIVKYTPNGNLYRATLANPVPPDTLAYDPTVSTSFWSLYTCTSATPTRTATATSTPRPTATATNTARSTATATTTARPTATATTARATSTATSRARATATSTTAPRATATATTARATATATTASGCTGVPAWVGGTTYSVGQTVTYVFQAGDSNPNPGVVGKTYKYACAFAHTNPTWTPGVAGPSVWVMQVACN